MRAALTIAAGAIAGAIAGALFSRRQQVDAPATPPEPVVAPSQPLLGPLIGWPPSLPGPYQQWYVGDVPPWGGPLTCSTSGEKP